MKKLMVPAVLGVLFTLMSIGSANAFGRDRFDGRRFDDRRGDRVEYRAPVREYRAPVREYGRRDYRPVYHADYRRCR